MQRASLVLTVTAAVAACGGAPPAKAKPIENRPEPRPPTVPPPPAPAPAGPPAPVELTAASLLFEAEIVELTGYTGTFTTRPLAVAMFENETSQHFIADDHAEAYDLAVRLWQFDADPAAALAHFDHLATLLPGVALTDEIATRSLRAFEGAIVGIAFVDEPNAVVVLLTCATSNASTSRPR